MILTASSEIIFVRRIHEITPNKNFNRTKYGSLLSCIFVNQKLRRLMQFENAAFKLHLAN